MGTSTAYSYILCDVSKSHHPHFEHRLQVGNPWFRPSFSCLIFLFCDTSPVYYNKVMNDILF
jgi:hypothetical protein